MADTVPRSTRAHPASKFGPRPISRAQSVAGDRLSLPTRPMVPVAPPVTLDPLYISASAASLWVAAELEDEDMAVAPGALALLNSFLDQMLFNFMAAARSTRLAQLRQAVPDVLKPRLGKEAMASADEELREYLGAGEDEESDSADGPETAPIFDLEHSWKLARLRCMVYTRLGDLEEEDVLDVIERENLDQPDGQPGRISNITPAGAIFLTSILEYIGEQALYHSGVLAQKRIWNSASRAPDASDGAASDHPKPAVARMVEEIDMLRLGREGPLARIWRSWRRPVWSPADSISRPLSPDAGSSEPDRGFPEPRRGSTVTAASAPETTTASTVGPTDPSEIPLPMSERDVDEIEVPGLAREIDDDGTEVPRNDLAVEHPKRPSSMIIPPTGAETPLTPSPSGVHRNLADRSSNRPYYARTRSRSLPTPPQSPLIEAEWRGTGSKVAAKEPGATVGPESSENDQKRQDTLKAGDGPHTADVPDKLDVDESKIPADADHAGAVVSSGSASAGAVGPGSPVGRGVQPEEKPKANAPRESVAVKILQTQPGGAPPPGLTGPSISQVTDFESIHVPEQLGPEIREQPEPQSFENDPEDLAPSSTDREPHAPSAETTARKPLADVPEDRTPVASSAPVGMPVSKLDRPRENVPNPERATHWTPFPVQSTTRAPVAAEAVQEKPLASPPNEDLHSSGHAKNTFSKSSAYSSHSKSSSSSSKLLAFTRDEYGRPIPSLASERVEAQRAAPPYRGASDARPPTAHSQRSQPKTPLKLHSSSDENRNASKRASFESEARKRSLENLIRGDETLHYTLTPKSAQAPKLPSVGAPGRTQTQDLADFFRTTGPPGDPHPSHKVQKSISSGKGPGGVPLPAKLDPKPSPRSAAAPPTPAMEFGMRISSSAKRKIGEPRDPKVEASGNWDLADYLRSTGPVSEQQLPGPLAPRLAAASTRSAGHPTKTAVARTPAAQPSAPPHLPTGEQSRTGQQPVQSPPSSSMSATSATSGATATSYGPRHQPREARVTRNASNNALIDFIREGPPRAPGEHRIPRAVAPFRRTMDSDDLNVLAAADKDPRTASSVASTQDSSTLARSVQSSNSRTALLESSKILNGKQPSGANGRPSDPPRAVNFGQPERPPRRLQRRVRDPYAIDDSDDDLEESVTPKGGRDEESLIDFLRNTEPPPGMTAQPIILSAPSKMVNSALGKKEGSSGLRFPSLNRQSSKSALYPKQDGPQPPAYTRGSTARSGSPHLSKVGSRVDGYKPTGATQAAHVDRNRAAGRSNGAPGISADYLHSNGDAQPRSASPHSTTPAKEDAGFRSFFSRRMSMKYR